LPRLYSSTSLRVTSYIAAAVFRSESVGGCGGLLTSCRQTTQNAVKSRLLLDEGIVQFSLITDYPSHGCVRVRLGIPLLRRMSKSGFGIYLPSHWLTRSATTRENGPFKSPKSEPPSKTRPTTSDQQSTVEIRH
jgi:hypothetical protein